MKMNHNEDFKSILYNNIKKKSNSEDIVSSILIKDLILDIKAKGSSIFFINEDDKMSLEKSLEAFYDLDGINHFTSPILTSNPETSWTFSGYIRKSLGKVTTKFNGNVQFSDYIRTINNQESKNETVSQYFKLEFSTNFKKWPNIEVGYKKSFSKIKSSNTKSSYTDSPYINLEYDFLNGFILSADYEKNIYSNYFNQKNYFEIVNASLFYQKEDSAWGFKISGTNILGVDFKYENSFSDYIITDNRTYIMPRIWLFTISYKL